MHLRPDELIDALEDALRPDRRQHVDTCERCQGALAEITRAMAEVRASGDVPEPSPLLWKHLGDRVRAATADVQPERSSWTLTFGWRPAAALAAFATLALVAVVVRHGAVRPSDATAMGPAEPAAVAVAADTGAGDDSLDFVAQLASSISYDELQQAAGPTRDATDAMVEQLTSAERAELVRLLKAETGSLE